MTVKKTNITGFVICVLTLGALSLSGINGVDNIVRIKKTGHRKGPILFNHQAHIEKYNTECIDCHHKGTNKKCSSCHKMKDQGSIINIKGAFHQQCHDCHRKTRGPRACGRCHKQK